MSGEFDKIIWDGLMREFKNAYGVAGLMGNLEGESSMIPYRVQGDFSQGYQTSKTYTHNVDTGAVTRSDFINRGPGGGGYGLAQWTYPTRKAGLYDRRRGRSIGDVNLAIEFLIFEMNRDFPGVANTIRTATNLEDPTREVLYKFEAPADPDATYPYRLRYAQQYYKRFSGGVVPPEPPAPGDLDIVLLKASQRWRMRRR